MVWCLFRSALAVLILLGARPLVAVGTGTTTGPAEIRSLSELKLPPVKHKPWIFQDFPILAWWAPPGDAKLEDFEAYRDAGFNLHPTNPDTAGERALELAAKAGVKSIPFREAQGFILPPAKVDWDRHKEQIVGWITRDEPHSLPAVVESVTSMNLLLQEDPSRWAMFNLLPPHAQGELGTTGVIEAAVRNGLPVISYDNYVIHKDGGSDDRMHFNNLDLFRKESLKYDRPFWAFALTIQHFHYRRPSESDVRWKQFTNLAYGAKGLWYFTYWGPTDWDNWDNKAIVDPKDGSKTELYHHVKAINHAVLAMGDVLLGLRSVDVFHTTPPEGQREFPKDKFWISAVEGEDALVGFFEDAAGTPYAMLVNKLHGAEKSAAETSDTITLTFAPDVEQVTAVNWLDGKPGTLKIENGKASLPVAGGTGVLLKADMSRDPSS